MMIDAPQGLFSNAQKAEQSTTDEWTLRTPQAGTWLTLWLFTQEDTSAMLILRTVLSSPFHWVFIMFINFHYSSTQTYHYMGGGGGFD